MTADKKYEYNKTVRYDPAMAKRLKDARTQLVDNSQKIAADKLEISQSQLSYFERGIREIPMELIKRLQKAHNLNPAWILNAERPIKLDDKRKANTMINVAEMSERLDAMELKMEAYAKNLTQAWKTIEIQSKQIDRITEELLSKE